MLVTLSSGKNAQDICTAAHVSCHSPFSPLRQKSLSLNSSSAFSLHGASLNRPSVSSEKKATSKGEKRARHEFWESNCSHKCRRSASRLIICLTINVSVYDKNNNISQLWSEKLSSLSLTSSS